MSITPKDWQTSVSALVFAFTVCDRQTGRQKRSQFMATMTTIKMLGGTAIAGTGREVPLSEIDANGVYLGSFEADNGQPDVFVPDGGGKAPASEGPGPAK
jgi:hypothetical protein